MTTVDHPAPTMVGPLGVVHRYLTGPQHGPIAQLLIAWSPLSLILVLYALGDWIDDTLPVTTAGEATNRLGVGLHVTAAPRADEWLFGVLPSQWLQHHLVDGTPHWYDVAAALVYATHFVAIPLVTALVWFRLRERFGRWLVAVLAFTTLGVVGYVLYPAVPPWLASAHGAIGPVHRISDLGWPFLHLDVVGRLIATGQAGSNPVAAMPSLHAGGALLVALFLAPSATLGQRLVLAGYVLAMALALVYTGEHYVVDVVAGWLVALAAIGAADASHRARAGRARRRACRVGQAGLSSVARESVRVRAP